MAAGPKIRDAKPSDAERIAEINAAGWRAAYVGMIDDERLAAIDAGEWARTIRGNLERLSEGSFSLVAIEGSEIAGSCFVVSPPRDDDLGPEFAELVAIYVHPASWRTGIGSALLGAAQARAAGSGSTSMSLWTLTKNAPAQAFYERHGWRRDGAEQVHPIAEAPAIRMRRRLP
ncbi:MAG TPA: GNAT family N-acetyltransferase [Solirubrobacterales bacterium]|nr:GNAT family N-acetyltransferase [Solirubrobacterales bacterium]